MTQRLLTADGCEQCLYGDQVNEFFPLFSQCKSNEVVSCDEAHACVPGTAYVYQDLHAYSNEVLGQLGCLTWGNTTAMLHISRWSSTEPNCPAACGAVSKPSTSGPKPRRTMPRFLQRSLPPLLMSSISTTRASSNETEAGAVLARFEEWPLENVLLKRITENGITTFSCSSTGARVESMVMPVALLGTDSIHFRQRRRARPSELRPRKPDTHPNKMTYSSS